MKSYYRNIISLNERFAYNLIGVLRKILLPLSNLLLNSQKRIVKKRIFNNIQVVKNQLGSILPLIEKEDMLSVMTVEQCKNLIDEANKILLHEFKILSKEIKFKGKIDWNVDFNSGFRWPKGKIYSKYNQIDLANNADIKFPRELSRCHHFLILGEAYILTKDEKYTEEFIDQFRSWICENPYKKSINWGCSMDISIRACNWIYALKMFSESSLIDDEFLLEIFTSLYLHGRFINEHPEKNRSYNHNHYLSDLAGQILISLLFVELNYDEVNFWKKNGLYEFFKEIRLQILPSGLSYERTTNYHRLVTELISYTIIVLKNNHIEVPQDILYRIKKMFESILYYMFSDGMAPIIGDQDNGRFLPFYNYDTNYQKYLLNVGAILFNDGIFMSFSSNNNIDVLFLYGKKVMERNLLLEPKIIKLKSKPFPDAGFYTMRTENIYLFINNSGLSHYNEEIMGTHTHSDLLSFVYEYDGVTFLVDPGTYTYSSDPDERMKFRKTSMHNTLTVDGLDQNDLTTQDIWSIKRDAIPKDVRWMDTDNVIRFEGSHTGFERLTNPVNHKRYFELHKKSNNLKITDKVSGIGLHNIKIHLHFDEKVKVKINDKILSCSKEGRKIKISFESTENYKLDLKEEYISKSYNQKTLAPYLELISSMEDSIQIITNIHAEN